MVSTLEMKSRPPGRLSLSSDVYKRQSLIRPTEKTVVERIPPRLKVRQGACMELPHIMILIDDPDRTIIEPRCV